MASEDLREYLEAARQRRVHEQDARKQEMAARHEARRRDFEARSEPLNVHVVRVLEGARADLAEAGAKLEYKFQPKFDGKLSTYGLDPKRKTKSGIRAAIIREKGVNSDREMAYALYLAGFDVKDVHMTDLVSGREDLSDVNMIVFVGGFSNSDVY